MKTKITLLFILLSAICTGQTYDRNNTVHTKRQSFNGGLLINDSCLYIDRSADSASLRVRGHDLHIGGNPTLDSIIFDKPTNIVGGGGASVPSGSDYVILNNSGGLDTTFMLKTVQSQRSFTISADSILIPGLPDPTDGNQILMISQTGRLISPGNIDTTHTNAVSRIVGNTNVLVTPKGKTDSLSLKVYDGGGGSGIDNSILFVRGDTLKGNPQRLLCNEQLDVIDFLSFTGLGIDISGNVLQSGDWQNNNNQTKIIINDDSSAIYYTAFQTHLFQGGRVYIQDLNVAATAKVVTVTNGFLATGSSAYHDVNATVVNTQFNKTNTTLSNVTNLTASLLTGHTYSFDCWLHTTSNVAGGVKAAINYATGTSSTIIYEGFTADAGSITQTRATSSGATVGAVTAVTAATMHIVGTIVTTGSSGVLTVQFAENVAVGTSSVLVGSTLIVTQIN